MYKPVRDYRFEYAEDAINFIEKHQCGNCIFRRTDQDAIDYDYLMCAEISISISLEEPVEEIDDLGSNGLSCTKYRNGDPTPAQVDGQEELF